MIDKTAKEEIVEVEEIVETPPQETPPQETPPSLTIQDLENLRNIIDVASKRGVFKTEEFAMVGTAYGKLSTFITAISPAPALADDDAVAGE